MGVSPGQKRLAVITRCHRKAGFHYSSQVHLLQKSHDSFMILCAILTCHGAVLILLLYQRILLIKKKNMSSENISQVIYP